MADDLRSKVREQIDTIRAQQEGRPAISSITWADAIRGILGDCAGHGGYRKVGACTYCSCGRRLYTGEPISDGELIELQSALAEEAGETPAAQDPQCNRAPDCPLHPDRGWHDECRSCHAVVDRAVTPPTADSSQTKMMPINRDSVDDPAGNVEVWRDNGGTLRYRVMKKDEAPRRGRHRGISHFATCPDSDQWRKRQPQGSGDT